LKKSRKFLSVIKVNVGTRQNFGPNISINFTAQSSVLLIMLHCAAALM